MLAFNIVFFIDKRAVSEAWRLRTLAQERNRIKSVKVLRSCQRQQCEREASAEGLERKAGMRSNREHSGVKVSS